MVCLLCDLDLWCVVSPAPKAAPYWVLWILCGHSSDDIGSLATGGLCMIQSDISFHTNTEHLATYHRGQHLRQKQLLSTIIHVTSYKRRQLISTSSQRTPPGDQRYRVAARRSSDHCTTNSDHDVNPQVYICEYSLEIFSSRRRSILLAMSPSHLPLSALDIE